MEATYASECIETENNIEESLINHMFKKYGNSYIYHSDIGNITVVLPELQVYIESAVNIKQTVIDEKVQEFIKNIDEFVPRLLEWFIEQTTDSSETGFYSGDDKPEEIPQMTDNYFTKSLKPLLIYSWGRKLRKGPPLNVQKNFNAAILNGRRKGINLKKMDGRWEEVQDVVKKCKMFLSLMESVQKEIEKKDLTIVAFNCSKGRHRSVAAAELLKELLYPNSTIIHLELK